jgi:hypothetical protein
MPLLPFVMLSPEAVICFSGRQQSEGNNVDQTQRSIFWLSSGQMMTSTAAGRVVFQIDKNGAVVGSALTAGTSRTLNTSRKVQADYLEFLGTGTGWAR